MRFRFNVHTIFEGLQDKFFAAKIVVLEKKNTWLQNFFKMDIFGPTTGEHDNIIKAILIARCREGATISEIRGNYIKNRLY